MGTSIKRTPPALTAILWLFIMMCLVTSPIGRAHADGGVLLGSTTLLNSGDTALKVDLVFLGDGFTVDEQDAFNALVDDAVIDFLSAHPIHAMQGAFNVHRINVSSPESGTDTFSSCDGEDTGDDDAARETALDSGYCNAGNGTVYRCMFSSNTALAFDFAANAPADDIIIVLVNDTGHGGCAGGDITYLTLTSQYTNVVIHELGHSLFLLADEYNYGRDDTFTGVEPGAENITIATDISQLKWADLVITSSPFSSATPIPTQAKPDCTNEALPPPNFADDIIGTFEGARYSRCGIYRSQYDGRMRRSNVDFNAVNRRQIIRILVPHVGLEGSVFFDELLVKNDHDGWATGKGDIYINYELTSNLMTKGRWPSSGDVGIGTGDTKTLNFMAGVVGSGFGTPATISLKVRDSDWGNDDELRNDTTENLPPGGRFAIDERDYKLSGRIIGPVYKILFDTLNIKNDQDPFTQGDIFVNYTVSNGNETISGRWPRFGDTGISDNQTRNVNILAGAINIPTAGNELRVKFRVMDSDFLFDDELGNETFAFLASDNFGADKVVHVQDQRNYRLTMSIIGPLLPVDDGDPPIID